MRCPTCVSENKRSTVTVGQPAKTVNGVPVQFFDEDGQYHYHDPAKYSTPHKCSNGHLFDIASVHGCPQCGDTWRPENQAKEEKKNAL